MFYYECFTLITRAANYWVYTCSENDDIIIRFEMLAIDLYLLQLPFEVIEFVRHQGG